MINRNFYDASKASEMTQKVLNEREEDQLVELFDMIDSHVLAGEFDCVFVDLTIFQQDWLEHHGYEVTKVDNPNSWQDKMYKVSWK